MTQSDSFRSQLLHRIDSYRESETKVDARLAELAEEKAAQASAGAPPKTCSALSSVRFQRPSRRLARPRSSI